MAKYRPADDGLSRFIADDPSLAGAAQGLIDRLQALVGIADVKSLDGPQLRERSEELAVALEMGAAKMGLAKPNLGD